jgi:hypothetical protein
MEKSEPLSNLKQRMTIYELSTSLGMKPIEGYQKFTEEQADKEIKRLQDMEKDFRHNHTGRRCYA